MDNFFDDMPRPTIYNKNYYKREYYRYKKICEEFEEWLRDVMNLYKNNPELEKYVLRSKEYRKVLVNFEIIKQNYIKEEIDK